VTVVPTLLVGRADENCVSTPPAGEAVQFRDRPVGPERDPLSFDMWRDRAALTAT